MAQQHLLGHVHQLGVERSLGLCQQMMDGTGRVSVQALRDGGLGGFVDVDQAFAHKVAIRRVQVAVAFRQKLGQAARVLA